MGRKSVRIASLFSLFSFGIFLDSTKRIFPDSGVPYPLVSTVGFAIFAISGTRPVKTGLASVTERHAVGRNMAPMGRRRSCSACCWRAGSGQRTSITPGGIARVDRRVTAGAVARFAMSFKMLVTEGGPTGHSDLGNFDLCRHALPSRPPRRHARRGLPALRMRMLIRVTAPLQELTDRKSSSKRFGLYLAAAPRKWIIWLSIERWLLCSMLCKWISLSCEWIGSSRDNRINFVLTLDDRLHCRRTSSQL